MKALRNLQRTRQRLMAEEFRLSVVILTTPKPCSPEGTQDSALQEWWPTPEFDPSEPDATFQGQVLSETLKHQQLLLNLPTKSPVGGQTGILESIALNPAIFLYGVATGATLQLGQYFLPAKLQAKVEQKLAQTQTEALKPEILVAAWHLINPVLLRLLMRNDFFVQQTREAFTNVTGQPTTELQFQNTETLQQKFWALMSQGTPQRAQAEADALAHETGALMEMSQTAAGQYQSVDALQAKLTQLQGWLLDRVDAVQKIHWLGTDDDQARKTIAELLIANGAGEAKRLTPLGLIGVWIMTRAQHSEHINMAMAIASLTTVTDWWLTEGQQRLAQDIAQKTSLESKGS